MSVCPVCRHRTEPGRQTCGRPKCFEIVTWGASLQLHRTSSPPAPAKRDPYETAFRNSPCCDSCGAVGACDCAGKP